MTSPDDTAIFTTISFEAVISTWHERPRCEIPTKSGSQCQHSAAMHVDFHGCSSGLMCTQHWQAWHRTALAVAAADRRPGAVCKWCGGKFASVDDSCTVVAL